MIENMSEHSKLLDQLLVRDREREAMQIHMDVVRACITSTRSRLNEEKEQIIQLKVLVFHIYLNIMLFQICKFPYDSCRILNS